MHVTNEQGCDQTCDNESTRRSEHGGLTQMPLACASRALGRLTHGSYLQYGARAAQTLAY